MGKFISMSGIIGKSQSEVLETLKSYFDNQNKELKETALNTEIYDLFLLNEEKNNSIIIYPEEFFEFKVMAVYFSEKFKKPIFNFYIYDGYLWMYEMYYDGQLIDKFNPIPSFLDHENEIDSYKGNPEIVCKYLKSIELSEIKEYYKFWTEELINSKEKAYPTDEFSYGMDWQVVDFMKKLNLKYPIIDEEETIGRAFKLI